MFNKTTKLIVRALCLVLVVVMALGCIGCNGDNGGSGDKGGPNKGGNSNVNAEKYRGTTVVYATWKNPYQNEDGKVVDDFQKKYGIKVEIDITPQATYVQEVAGKIAAGESPDIFFDNCFFPASISSYSRLTLWN